MSEFTPWTKDEYIEQLQKDCRVFIAQRLEAHRENDRLKGRIEKLEAALRPFANLFLYPDDLGFEASLDIKEDPDWDDDANDMQTEDCFVLRRSIKAARTALKWEKTND